MKAKIVIDREVTVGETDKRLFGSFIEHLGRAVYEGIYQPSHFSADNNGFRQDTADLIKKLGISAVRYPGGNFVSGYRWEDGIGPKDKRPQRLDYAWKVIETNQFGLDEFNDWCKTVDAEPIMAVNLGTRGMDDAKDLLEYCNHPFGSKMSDLRIKNGHKEPYNIKMWCLGNEMDGPWQMGHKTANEYARIAAEVGRIFKTYDSNLQMIVCGSSMYSMPTFGEWERTVLFETYDIADYLSLHMYFDNFNNDTPSFLAKNLVMDDFIYRVICICDYVQSVKHSKKNINLSFDEWNVWYHSKGAKIPEWTEHPHQLEDIYNFEDAMLVGSALITLLRHCDRVKIACLAQLVNVIAPIMTSDNGVWKQTTYYPFFYTSLYGRGTVLQTTVKCPTYSCTVSDEAPYIDSVAAQNDEDETLTLFIVNKSLNDTAHIECDLRQYSDYKVVEHIVMSNDDFKAVNTEENPENVVPYQIDASNIDNGLFTSNIPAHSWNVIHLKKQ